MSNNEQNSIGLGIVDPEKLDPRNRGVAEYAAHTLGLLAVGRDTLSKAQTKLEEAELSTDNLPEAQQVLRSIAETVSQDFAKAAGFTIPEGAIVDVEPVRKNGTTTPEGEGR